MTSTNFNISSNNSNRELHEKAVKLEQDEYSNFDSTPRQESIPYINRPETEGNRRTDVLHTTRNGATISNHNQSSLDDSSLCSTSSLCPAPLCRQFWRAGNYDDGLNSKPPSQNGTTFLRIHPKFLHSNATSHKWAFGAMAELLDNSVDEIQNGATFVIVDKTSNPRDGTPALLIQDNGGGMDPNAMRRCISFGFSDKKSKTAIGQYGNGFKTSSMRLGADVIVFSRQMKDRKLTQSVGLLSYTFLMQTRHDRIVVPMVDYQFNPETRTWNSIHNEEHLKTNLSILLQWSPFATEDELLKQFDNIGRQGTKIMIYNLWHNDEGKLELDFELDSEDICISKKDKDTSKAGSRNAINERHLANRLQHSLRAYLSILYLRIPDEFSILLRGRVVERHNIAQDLKFPEFILYKPQNVEGSVITTIGFLKEAPEVNVHGFNVYHKNRLILPFWHVVTYSDSRGRGVVGVLEANFIEPTHNKQEFEKTPVFQKLETRLKEMTQEYWDFHCGLLGYQIKKKAQPAMSNHASFASQQGHSIFQPVILGPKVSTGVRPIQHEINGSSRPFPRRNAQGGPITVKRKSHDHLAGPEMGKRMNTGSRTTSIAHGGNIQVLNNSFQHAVESGPQFENQEAVNIIQENKKLRAQCQEYEKSHEELNHKITRLNIEVREKRREYARLLIDLRTLEKEKVKPENRATT